MQTHDAPAARALRKRRTGPAIRLAALIGLLALGAQSPAAAQDADSARKIVQSMSTYLAANRNVTAQFDVDLEVITPEVEKLTFSASGTVGLSRPDKVRVIRTGGYTDVEFNFDGKTLTVLNRATNIYSQIPAAGTVDALVERMRSEMNVELPGMDLLLADSYAVLMDGVLTAKAIGVGVVNGVECHHLAFRNADVDWQLWVRTGPKPVPCKYVVTSKAMAAAPQYRILFHNFNVDNDAPASFAFSAPAGAKSVPIAQLSGIGELPPPSSSGDKK